MDYRPLGISILSVFHLFGGILLFIAQFFLLANLERTEEPLRAVGIPPALLVVGVMLLAVIAMASGFGMLLGAKWGWWLSTFYYVYSIFRHSDALYFVVRYSELIEDGTRGPEYYYFKYGGRVVVHLLLLLYFFKGNVLQYFGLSNLKKMRAFSVLIAITTAISVAFALIAR